ncbi:MAG TPA: DUF3253 domain-containing protein [Nocardioides sp.]|nr:DUF3253 domain-containing protein [Nocardioides sp.]
MAAEHPGTPASQEAALAEVILGLLAQRRPGATICPSDAARVAAGDGADEGASEEEWRALMDPVRRAAQDLVRRGLVEITQGGEVVELATARGPIRIRLVPRE